MKANIREKVSLRKSTTKYSYQSNMYMYVTLYVYIVLCRPYVHIVLCEKVTLCKSITNKFFLLST